MTIRNNLRGLAHTGTFNQAPSVPGEPSDQKKHCSPGMSISLIRLGFLSLMMLLRFIYTHLCYGGFAMADIKGQFLYLKNYNYLSFFPVIKFKCDHVKLL